MLLYLAALAVTVAGSLYLNGYKFKDNWMFFLAAAIPGLNVLTATVILLIFVITRNFNG